VLWAYYKIRHRTKVIAPADADLVTGKREIDEEEETYLRREAAKGPQTWKQKLWDSL
jgi:amino acid transporter